MRHLDPMHMYGFSSVQKETKKASEGLGTTFRHELKNLVRFRRASPTKRTSGGFRRGGGSPPFFGLSWAFFDFNEIH